MLRGKVCRWSVILWSILSHTQSANILGATGAHRCKYSKTFLLVSKLSEKPFMIREGSSLLQLVIAVRRYGRRFRRQITSLTALRGTVCRWTVVRWSADAADFEDELKKTPIG